MRGEVAPESSLVLAFAASLALAAALAWWSTPGSSVRLRTVSAVLEAYREGDFSVRARSGPRGTALSEVLRELNQLGDVLRAHRLGEMEAWTLLRKVMAEVDVVVVAVDDDGRVRLANDAAARLLRQVSRRLVGVPAAELGLARLLEGEVPRIVDGGATSEPAGRPPFDAARAGGSCGAASFRLAGEPQTLVVLSDVSSALRDNEREAWRRLVRVIGHEINNSLSPIISIAGSMTSLLDPSRPRDDEWTTDLRDGLGVISRRAEALGRFMTSYATLARLPPPVLAPVNIGSLLGKIVSLETRAPIELLGGPEITVSGDSDQLEQAFINLVKNAAEATLEARNGTPGKAGSVRVRWAEEDGAVAVAIEDDGLGVGETANLFVPFFTTKANGSGIGLALSRQIVEAHDGQLSLASRPGGGAIARIRLPLLA